jgi:anti-sigma-K factor RskA
MMDRETLLESIPAYALGALDEEERRQVEQLLATDAEAQERLAEYEAVAELLVMDVPMRQAPAHLKDNLRQRLAEQPPQASATAPMPAHDSNVTAFPPQSQVPQRSTTRRLWMAAAAAVVVLFIGAGLFGVLMLNQPQPLRGAALWAQLRAQEDSQRFPVDNGDFEGVTGELLVSADGTQAVLRIANFPVISDEQTFQFWLVTEEEDRSGGTWFPRADREEFFITLDLDVPLQQLVRIGCSVEPEGGSESPTGPRVFNIPLRGV